MTFRHALILAAGRGERMMPLTANKPKALVTLGNKPLIQYTIDTLRKQGVERIYVTYGWQGKMLVDYLHNKVEGLINTTNQDNAGFLSTSVLQYVDAPMLVCPCDLTFDIDLAALKLEHTLAVKRPIYLIPVQASKNADFIHTGDFLAVTDITRERKSELCASGIQIINPLMLNQWIHPPSNFYGVWTNLIKLGGLGVTTTTPSNWSSYDSEEDVFRWHYPTDPQDVWPSTPQ